MSPFYRIGNLLGERKAIRAGVAANTSIVMALIISGISRYVSAPFTRQDAPPNKHLLLAPCSSSSVINGPTSSTMIQVGNQFSDQPFHESDLHDKQAVVSLVASILPLVALFQVFDGNCAVTAGILRARGKQASFSTSDTLTMSLINAHRSSRVRF